MRFERTLNLAGLEIDHQGTASFFADHSERTAITGQINSDRNKWKINFQRRADSKRARCLAFQ